MLNHALAGITVLDFSQGIAGPHGACLLGEMGAEVIKIEPPAGDWLRGLGHRQGGTSVLFGYFNRGKAGVALDLKDPAQRRQALALIDKADVLIESNRPGVMARLGLGYEQARQRNPGLVYISVTGFGQDGPHRDLPATDAAMQAYSGFSFGAGDMRDPVRVRVSVVDIVTGVYVSNAALAALMARHGNQGQGQYIDLSLMHGISAVQGAKYAEHAATRGVISRELYAAIGIYPTRDGHIALSAMRDQQVTDFIGLAGRADLLADPRYATQQARYDNQDELRALIAAELAKQPTAHWIEAARRIDLICQPVQTYDQFRQDPQVRTYELFQDMDLGYDMPLPAVRMPGMTATQASLRPPPRLGADTAAVLRRHGASPPSADATP
ncbi:CoA transferase [Bordetella bronchiseptica]|uniref:CoA transferase n=4 Tax=Bordetella bronchiseptica TaxID=518 RepID=A0A0H3LRE0_BORBR|nr:CoA transferase [Bordetella bronchiseptica]KAK61822.1 CoA-transferase family III protein [Bordetella bronchiseptica 980-2]SHP69889.1 L-carnitine dehydratase/bile acid-inducible protein F [Mycobacteroides abscessus subsp. abscessus]AMG90655.1 CoA transferase [Bordetella bronchiseptica]AWP77194.1 CoA transferase [Bordetella bronchiseptica]AWP82051.1 CoA transferase [Bordetella bronchiseptica]